MCSVNFYKQTTFFHYKSVAVSRK